MLHAEKILAIGAHPDDIEFGCYGTLSLLAQRSEVHALILSDCNEDGWGSTHGEPTRAAETREALAPVTRSVTVLDLKHSQLEFPNQASVKAVSETIEAIKPSFVFTHVKWDTHQDHRTVEQITLSACRRLPITIVGYHAPSASADFVVNMVVDVTTAFNNKLNALARHRSQSNQPYMDKDWIYRWHRSKLATGVGCDLVELFHIYQMFWPHGAPGVWRR